MKEATQDKFIGNWKKGKKNGKGTYETNESIIRGNWMNDKLFGEVEV
jgi:hypothetical protein